MSCATSSSSESSRRTGCTRRRRAPGGADRGVIAVEVSNRSGVAIDEEGASALARSVLEAEGVDEGELGLLFVGPDEMRTLRREHLGGDEPTDVLSFPLDGRARLAHGLPRLLGAEVLCPQVVGAAWWKQRVHRRMHQVR